MKRILFSVAGTIGALVALLDFKSHSPIASGALPAASLPTSSATGATTPTAGASTPPATSGPTAAASSSHTYVGQAVQTQYGVVQVEVTVAGGKITNAKFVQLTAYDGRSQRINSQAGPMLLQQTLAAQSAQIDGVSGASYTSAGYQQSLQSALDQAGIK